MKEIDDNELKIVELEILKSIDEFCKENSLKYFLAYGTLIGAIRHKGFIPWDDDIDIQMPRDDYNRMIALYNSNNRSKGRYKLISPYDKNSKHSYVKVIDTQTIKVEPGVKYSSGFLGVDVDIFPIDGMPDEDEVYVKWYKELYDIYKRFRYSNMYSNNGNFIHKIGVMARKLIYHRKKKYLNKAEKMHSLYRFSDCEFVGTMECIYNGMGNRTKKVNFSESIEWKFEDCFFSIPKGYDEILRNIYGDYMQLPPKEEQVSHHSNSAFWIE